MKMSNILSGTPLSENYNKRKFYLQNDILPLQREIRHNLGDTLTNVYFSQMSEESMNIVGQEPPLKGPGDKLMVYPEDEIKDAPKLKPISVKEVQALTHQGVLDIGLKTLNKWEYENDQLIQKAISDNDETWKWLTKEHCRKCVKKAIAKERILQEKDIKNIIKEFSDLHKANHEQVEMQYHFLIEKQVEEMTEKMKNMYRLEKEAYVLDIVKNMENECQEKINNEVIKLKEHFDNVLMLEQARYVHEMNERVRILRHQLECRSVVDVLYTACTERHHYLIKQAQLEAHYTNKIETLKSELETCRKQLDSALSKLQYAECIDTKLKDRMKILCKEFRKLFSFHTKLPPAQLGFLPDLERMFVDTITCHNKELTEIREKIKLDHKIECHEETSSKNEISSDDVMFQSNFKMAQKTSSTPFIVCGDIKDKAELSSNVYKEEIISPERYFPKWLKDAKLTPIRLSADISCLDEKGHGKKAHTMSRDKEVEFQIVEPKKDKTHELYPTMFSTIAHNIMHRASIGLRTSILKKGSEPISVTSVMNEDYANVEDIKLTTSKHSIFSVHRDSLTLMKESKDKMPSESTSSLEILKRCPVEDCKFKSVVGYDLPSHVKHLTSVNVQDVGNYHYSNYEVATAEELAMIEKKFTNADNIANEKEKANRLKYTKILDDEDGLDNKPKESIDGQIESEVDNKQSNDECKIKGDKFELVGENENVKHLKMDPQCVTQHTLETIKRMFEETPSLAKNFLDIGRY